MGRSVSVPSDAVATTYLTYEGDYDEWDDFIEDIRNVVTERYPSFDEDDKWVDREEKSILLSRVARIVVAEYGGLVSVSLCPVAEQYGDPIPLNVAWCNRVAASWRKHMHKRYPGSALSKLGTFSNGESVYERVAQ